MRATRCTSSTRDGIQTGEVGGVVVGREAVALDVARKAGDGLGPLEREGKAAVEVVLDELEGAVRGRGLDHGPDLGEELHERAVGDFVAHAGAGAEAGLRSLSGPMELPGPVSVGLVLTEVLVEAAAKETAEHGVHDTAPATTSGCPGLR